ncbi:hypothetical protein NPIL_424681 [Nephila pilipes]|uniref:Uncharacterized protein n=1 Tax=Nephila pilipes TaxID=299642 RepID=A0A8X6PPQ8_NEPPI|nr:hypothetical protein NPIL_424681 [Nephila pilipes]
MALQQLFLLVVFISWITAADVLRPRRSHVDNFGECAGTCWCKRDSLTCQRPDTLDSIPILSSAEERSMITKIIIEKKIQDGKDKKKKSYGSLQNK